VSNGPTQVPEIGLRFTEKAWRGKDHERYRRTLVGFVRNRKNLQRLLPDVCPTDVSDDQAHSLSVRYLDRFWRLDRTCTAIVTNISMGDKQPVYLVRPVLEGAATAGYSTDRGIPAFRCILKDGYFLAIGFESGLWPDFGSEQVVLVGPVYIQMPPLPGEVLDRTRPPKPLSPEVLGMIARLKSKRLFVSRKVKEWSAFLNWQADIIRQKQIGVRYESVDIDESSHCLRFTISSSPEHWQKLAETKTLPVSVISLSDSKDPDQWVPRENARGVSIGELEVPSKQIKKMLSSKVSDAQLLGTLEVYPDPEMWEDYYG